MDEIFDEVQKFDDLHLPECLESVVFWLSTVRCSQSWCSSTTAPPLRVKRVNLFGHVFVRDHTSQLSGSKGTEALITKTGHFCNSCSTYHFPTNLPPNHPPEGAYTQSP